MIKRIEELSMNAWPAFQTNLYDGWVLRFADGYTKRANSINPLYNSTIPLDQKIACCETKYMRQNLPVVFKLTLGSFPKDIDSNLKKKGYAKLDETSVRVLKMSRHSRRKPEDVYIEKNLNNDWFDGFIKCSNIANTRDKLSAKKIMNNIMVEVIYVSKKIEENIVGCGLGVIERGHVGIFDIVVDKNYRGKGYGQDIIDGILNFAVIKGVNTAYLQVVVGNLPAEKLYDKLGFTEAYRYWYRRKP